MGLRSIVTLLLAAVSLLVVLALTVPADLGNYRTTFESNGLAGFVQMRSVIAVQIWLPAMVAILVPLGLREARRRQVPAAYQVLSLAKYCAIIGFLGYALAMGNIVYGSFSEFTISTVLDLSLVYVQWS
jgi:hypothetical protein